MAILVECPECKRRNNLKAKVCPGTKKRPCGFAWVSFPGGVYWIDYLMDGERRRERIGPNKEAAEHRMREVLSARAEGRHIKRARELKITFNDLSSRYHEWAKVNNKSYHVNKAYFINRVTKFFGARRLVDISPWLVEKWKAERSKETGFTEVDNELKTLKHMFNKGIEWRMSGENPDRTVKLFRKTQKKERFLSQDEMSQLLNHLPYHQRPLIEFALLTGLRRANLLNLKWEQVDLEHGNLFIPAEETKGKRDLKLPLAPEAVEILRNHPRHLESEFVFCKANGEPYKDIYNGFREALKRAGIKDCTLHILRHTVGSHLVMAGVDLTTVKELLGHRDIQTTMRYAHLAHDHKREAIARLGKLVVNDTYSDTKPQAKEEGAKVITLTP